MFQTILGATDSAGNKFDLLLIFMELKTRKKETMQQKNEYNLKRCHSLFININIGHNI